MVTEKRVVSSFNEIELDGLGDALIMQQDDLGPERTIVIEADESILSKIKTEVRGERLVVGPNTEWWNVGFWLSWITLPNKTVRLSLPMEQVKKLSINGSGSIRAEQVQTAQCELRIAGSGKIHIDRLQAGNLESSISGSGNVELAGTATQHKIHISGSGNIRAADLDTQETRTDITGSGDAIVKAEERLRVEITGSGSVRYAGQAQLEQHITGSGRIAPLK